jgi:hypothetical protein
MMPDEPSQRGTRNRPFNRPEIWSSLPKRVAELSAFWDHDGVPSFGQTIRLSSYVSNPLGENKNYRADSDGCVGLHLDAGVAAAAGSRV